MEQIVVQGGRPLGGSVRVNGAKNAALPIMAASILTEGPTVLHRVPRLTDVETISEILRALGVALEWIGPDSLRLEPTANGSVEPPLHLVRDMRASVCVLGPLLAMRGAASMAMPGGCVIGRRPIDLHLKGLRALGARFETEGPYIRAEAGRLRGAPIDMAGPRGSTVLGTANVMMAATLAAGRTVIDYLFHPYNPPLTRLHNADITAEHRYNLKTPAFRFLADLVGLFNRCGRCKNTTVFVGHHPDVFIARFCYPVKSRTVIIFPERPCITADLVIALFFRFQTCAVARCQSTATAKTCCCNLY